MEKKTVVDQIIDFVKRHKERLNGEAFSVVEMVIQKGKLDGMRIKEYLKNREEK